MSLYRIGSVRGRRIRLAAATAVALGLHGAMALPAMLPHPVHEEESAVDGAVLIELAPVAVASRSDDTSSMPTPETAASDASVDQQQEEAKPQKSEDAPILPQSDRTDIADDLKMATARPKETKEETEPDRAVPTEEKPAPPTATAAASVAEAAQDAKVQADTAADRAQAAEQGVSEKALKKAIESWQREIITAIAQHRRYPLAARERRQHGTVIVRFGIDRAGHLVVSEIGSSSGHVHLDQEALDTLKRVKTFPTPPKALVGDTFAFSLPIKFRVVEQ